MATKSNNFKIGLFVVVSMALLIFALLFWGVLRYGGDTNTYVTYFNQDVSGLNKDTPVKYRGVNVGRITDVELAPDGELIEVVMALSADFKVTTQQITRIESAGITGLKYLGIGIATTPTNNIHFDFFPEYKVIPSRPSPGLTDLIIEFQKQMKSINLGAISAGLTQALHQINAATSEKNWGPIVSNMNIIAAVSREGSDVISHYIENGSLTNFINNSLFISEKARAIVENISPEYVSLLITQLTEISQSLNRSIYITESNLEPMLQDLSKTISNLRSFSESLKDRPSQTLFAKPPKE
ncbi:MCE family protein [bacterium]|nr:MCE family protein [bacterium]